MDYTQRLSRVTMQPRGRQETTPPTRPSGSGRARGATCRRRPHHLPRYRLAEHRRPRQRAADAHSASRCAAAQRTRAAERRVAADRQLRHRRHARPVDAHADRQRAHHLAQPGAIAGVFDPAAPLLERLPQHQLDVAEAAPAGRRRSVCRAPTPDDFGYTDVTRITIVNADGSDGLDLTKDLRFISPDDQNADDRSLAAATLVNAIEPGETLRLRVNWKGRFPKNFDRTGVIGNYFFVSQWFPKLGVFDAGAGPRTSSSPTRSSSPTSAATTSG